MDSFRNKSFFWACVILWGGLILWNVFTPALEFSEFENRYLKTFPHLTARTLLNGKFMEDVNVCLNDQFAGRPYWVGAQSMLEYLTGKREINGVYTGKDGRLFGALDPPDKDITAKNIAGIGVFAKKYGVPTYAALIPSAADIQKEYLPEFASGWDEKEYIGNVYAALGPSIKAIDIYGALKAHRNEYIYYRTDHHWTSLGARYAYSDAIAPAMGLSVPTPPKSVDALFLGTYHSKTGFPLARADIMDTAPAYGFKVESVEVFDGNEAVVKSGYYAGEFLEKKDKYSYFGGQVQPVVTIKTTADTDRKLIIFKDSYAHCLVPMMFGEFSEIRMVDLRFVNPMTIGGQLKAENYGEALFIYSTDVFSHQSGAGQLINIE